MSGGEALAAHRLSLADGLLPACEALASAVAAGFGPSFKSTLVVSSTGKLLMTNSGLRIMRSLDVDHPCARLVVECARRHHDLTGDNAKSFAVLLAELLRLVAADAASAGPLQQQQQRRQQLATELGRALASDDALPTLLSRLRDRAVVRVETNDPAGFRDALLDVIRGSLGCHLLEYDVLSLSALVRDYVLGWTAASAAAAAGESPAGEGVSRRRLPAILDLILHHFDALCVPCGSKPAASSRIIDGLLLSRCCHYAPRPRRRPQLVATTVEDEGCCSSGPEEDDVGGDNVPTHFLVMSCGLEAGGSGGSDGDDSDDDAGLEGTTRATLALRTALVDGGGGEPAAAAAVVAELLLKAFSTRSDRVTRFLVQCARAGVTLLVTTRTLSELERRLCHEYGVDYVHALPADEAQLLATIAGVPVVHDASECLLRGRLPSNAIGRARDCVQLQLGGGGAATYTNLVGVRSASCGARTLVTCGPTDGLCQQLRDCVRDALRCIRCAITSSGGYRRAEADGADESVAGGYRGEDDDELTLCAFPVGGAFEITLHQLISDHLSQQRPPAAAAAAPEALRLLADALLCVPRMLHANAYSFSKPRWPATLQDLKTSCSASSGEGPEGVHASTGASSRLSALQPLRSKELLVLHVVALARQLLRTDYVLPASAAALLPLPTTTNGIR